MRGTQAMLAAAALLACACATARPPASPEKTCVIVGGPRAPVEVRIYESDPYARPGGKRIFTGLLNRGERHVVESPTGKIWYAYAWHELDTWREGYEAPCHDGVVVNLP